MTGTEMDNREIVVQFPGTDKISFFGPPYSADRLCRITHTGLWVKRQRRDMN